MKSTSLFAGILACLATTSMLYARGDSLETVSRWDFGVGEDVKSDRWPDGWTRRSGLEYPKYIPIAITKRASSKEQLAEIDQMRRLYSQWFLAWKLKQYPWKITPETTPREFDRWLELTLINPYLEIQMDGGAAEVLSPMIRIETESVYGVRGQAFSDCTTDEFESFFTIRFFDEDKKLVFESSSPSITGLTPWQSLASHSQYEYREDLKWVQIALKVKPQSTKSFRGTFGFDAIELLRSPRLSLSVERPTRIYREGEEVQVECKASGMNTIQTSLDLQLTDHEGKVVDKVTVPVIPEDVEQKSNQSKDAPTGKFVRKNGELGLQTTPSGVKEFWKGSCRWVLPRLKPGFYEVRAQQERTVKNRFHLVQHFVVTPDKSKSITNPQIGWSLPEDQYASSIGTTELLNILQEANVGRLKLPVWHDTLDVNASNFLATRIDRIQSAGIPCVGVIATPPPSLLANFTRARPNDTGSALEDVAMTQTFLEPVLQQMCVRLVSFQLGWDDEADFVFNPRFQSSLDSIRRMLKRYGQEVQLIACHNPILTVSEDIQVDRWQWSTSISFGAEELKTLLNRASKDQSRRPVPWFHITPLPASQYSLKARVQDLLMQILVLTDPVNPGVRIGWVFDPANKETLLIEPDGGPQEMFLPFRNLSGALAGNHYLGQLRSKDICQNAILDANGEGKMVLWSPSPKRLKRYFGQKIAVRDVWGRQVPVDQWITDLGPIQSFEVGDWPLIVEGIDLPAMRWQMGLELLTKKVDLIVGKQELIEVQIDNPFDFAVVGQATVLCDALAEKHVPVEFHVGVNLKEKITIPVLMNPNADTGQTPIQVIVQFEGPENEVFISLNDLIEVGNNDIEFEIRHSINENNELVVEVETINRTGKPASFDCYIRIPGRTREFSQLSQLQDRAVQTFAIADADKLIGETIWVQSQLFGEKRVLNKRLTISR
jgi:hypothetical protein